MLVPTKHPRPYAIPSILGPSIFLWCIAFLAFSFAGLTPLHSIIEVGFVSCLIFAVYVIFHTLRKAMRS